MLRPLLPLFFACVALCMAGCNKPLQVAAAPQADRAAATPAIAVLNQKAFDEGASQTPPESHGVLFGKALKLAGAGLSNNDGGCRLTLYWNGVADQSRGYALFVQTLSSDGKILSQTDHPIDAEVRPGAFWRDAFQVTSAQMGSAKALAIGVYKPGGEVLTADRGKRDWNNARLWLSLPEKR